jgi:hypothetical protein|eukprot:CAMPEP_0174303968 /NCGR_PEP_ID=MMETSP0809-20121228/60500_1 /TAXON_ID=73025 ORGANISM="Eutreptiella gymnastica-like, Strain CCMP1594" /NCGR_SAMPLE_ID=MMETSP0809 /ASSEMBLY_ACC=CAM_ASM_000658 /LENGTH=348 /DNA_ID=CAMNT_0015410095 /DNA_START=25 /DNA_END=1071 /DNA_ORIENTATION=+
MVQLKCVGRGSGGVDEMKEFCNEAAVQWGLVCFTFGSGTFKRHKNIFVHFNGQNVGAVKRGKFNSQKSDVIDQLGSTHSDIEITSKDECTTDHFFDSLNRVFVSDSGNFSLSELKEQYMQSVVDCVGMDPLASVASLEIQIGKRPLASEMKVKGDRVLDAVREERGPFNWALYYPDPNQLKLFNAGSLSVSELKRVLPEDEVLYGLVRMGFGAGQFRRTKWVFVHWIGEKTGAVKRGKAMSVKSEMLDLLKPHNVDVQVSTPAELEIRLFIERMTKMFVVDGKNELDKEVGFGFDEFMAALAEEQRANAEFFGDCGEIDPDVEYDFKETVDAVRKTDNPINWALFVTK